MTQHRTAALSCWVLWQIGGVRLHMDVTFTITLVSTVFIPKPPPASSRWRGVPIWRHQ